MMSNINKIKIKQYDTVDIDCEYLNDNDTPLSLEGISVYADLQTTSGALVSSFSVSMPNPNSGQFNLALADDYLDIGSYRVDILFTDAQSGYRVSSETFNLVVSPAITKPRV